MLRLAVTPSAGSSLLAAHVANVAWIRLVKLAKRKLSTRANKPGGRGVLHGSSYRGAGARQV